MSILSSIKSEKNLTFGHWRYRILHWFFNKHPKDVEEALSMDMPKCFYTHYCPLFHLTNLLVLTAPFIILVRFVVWLAKAAASLLNFVAPHIPKPKTSQKSIRKRDIRTIIDFAKISPREFDDAWENLLANSMLIITKDEAKNIWETYRAKQEIILNKKEEQKQKVREQTVFWVNFSQVFFKIFFNVVYAALALLILYAAWMYASIIFIVIWNFSVLEFLLTFISLMLYGLLIGVVVVGLYFAVGRKVFPILGDALGGFFVWIGNTVRGVGEFFSVFYEENCPPIKIVSEEEAIMEELA